MTTRVPPSLPFRDRSRRTSSARLAALVAGTLLGTSAFAAERPVAERIDAHTFPAVFQPWNGARNLGGDPLEAIARHDVYFTSPSALGLRWQGSSIGTATALEPGSLAAGRARRAELLERNPDLVILAEVRYRDAWPDYLPDASHPWWMRDGSGRVVPGWSDGPDMNLPLDQADTWRIEFRDPAFQDSVAAKSRALLDSGVVDGVMLDWWGGTEYIDARLQLLQKVRAAIGDEALIVVNSNARTIPESASYVNGMFMELGWDNSPEAWARNLELLRWGSANLRTPRLLLYESWYERSANERDVMRANATLSMIAADGYALFAEPNEIDGPDHRHLWYDFYDVDLGRPRGPGWRRDDGAWERVFARGRAIYNPPGNAALDVRFDVPMRSTRTGRTRRLHRVPAFDGDTFIRTADAVSITAIEPTGALRAAGKRQVRITLRTDEPLDLALSLQDTARDWVTHGFVRTRVAAGAREAVVTLPIDADAPVADSYALTAYLLPAGERWDGRRTHLTRHDIGVGARP